MISTALAVRLAVVALPLGIADPPARAAPDPEGVRFPRSGEVVPFARPGTSLLWFGELKTSGAVSAKVEVTAPKGGRVTLRLAAANEPRDQAQRNDWSKATAVPRDVAVVGSGAPQRVSFGSFTVAAPGYVRFALSSPGRGAARTVKVTALMRDGAPTADAHFNLLPRRNAASVHLRYPTDSTALVTGFYNEVTAVDDPVTTCYMATGFARGYFGMQVNAPTERRIIFSVWDAGAGTNANDRSVVAVEDRTQLVATAAVDATRTTYSGYWFHPDKRQWMLIASFRAPNDGKGLRRLYSFSEDFGGETGHLRRRALFGPSWIRLGDGTWQELTTVTFSHDVTGRAGRFDRWMGVEDGRFFLQHGGFVSGFTATGTAFTRPATGTPPQIDLPR